MPARSVAAFVLTIVLLAAVACQSAAPPPRSAGAEAAAPAAGAVAPAAQAPAASGGRTRVSIGVTETVETQNPYGDSVTLLYGIWCEIQGCLVGFDPVKGEYTPGLAESWRVETPTAWIFNLRRNARWHDGSPFTAADVLYSFDRIANDPGTKQKSNIAPVERVEAVDDYTIRVHTKGPTSSLLDYLK